MFYSLKLAVMLNEGLHMGNYSRMGAFFDKSILSVGASSAGGGGGGGLI